MIIFLRDRNGAKQCIASVFSWEYHLDNSHDSKLTVSGMYKDYEGGQLLITNPDVGASYAGIISTVTPEEGITNIAFKPVISIFDRKIPYVPAEDMGAFITNAIRLNFGDMQQDAAFRTPWLEVSINDAGAYAEPAVDDYGYFNLESYIIDQQSSGRITLMAEPTATGIRLINKKSESVPVWFDSSAHELISESYSSSVCAKITNRVTEDETEIQTITDWYLFTDGTFSMDPSAGERAEGTWEIADGLDDEGIANEFRKAQYEHKISFYSVNEFQPGQQVRFRMADGRIVNSIISCVRIESDEDRIYYEAGNLKTTLTEILGGLR